MFIVPIFVKERAFFGDPDPIIEMRSDPDPACSIYCQRNNISIDYQLYLLLCLKKKFFSQRLDPDPRPCLIRLLSILSIEK